MLKSKPRNNHQNKVKKTYKISNLLLFFALFFIPFCVSANTLKTGDLVKLENSASVYQIQANGTRLVFPNEAVYKNYYDNFDNVKIVDFEELKKYSFTGNVKLKQGTLVKFTYNNKVYEVKSNHSLEWIKNEDGFKQMGYSFEDVVELPEVLFADYLTRVLNGSYYEVLNKIKDNFVFQERVDGIENVASSSEGLVEALNDDYSVFWSAEEYDEFMKWINNDSFEGIGAQIEIVDNELVIVTPLKGSPAEVAGLLAGDVVMFIDDYDATNISLTKSVMLLRGKKGTTVNLKIKRNGVDNLILISIIRDTIVVPQFSWEIKNTNKNKKIAYLNLSQFSQGAWVDFLKAKDDIIKANVGGMILDLRNNPGGYLGMAIEVASKWLDAEKIVLVEKRVGGNTINYVSNQNNYFNEIPLVVLVNKGSASASEIVASALKEHKVARIIGEQTFGKGVVQEIMPLEDGNVIKLTVSEWFTPNRNKINGIGVQPDLIILNSPNIDTQLQRALEELDIIIDNIQNQ